MRRDQDVPNSLSSSQVVRYVSLPISKREIENLFIQNFVKKWVQEFWKTIRQLLILISTDFAHQDYYPNLRSSISSNPWLVFNSPQEQVTNPRFVVSSLKPSIAITNSITDWISVA
jgi:hypothetical protein